MFKHCWFIFYKLFIYQSRNLILCLNIKKIYDVAGIIYQSRNLILCLN